MLGLSQETIGAAIGVTFQQIQKYERGVNRMGSSRLFEFSKFMKMPISFFFEGFEEEEPALPPGLAEEAQAGFQLEDITTRETLEVMRNYNRITDPSVRRKISDLIRSLAS